MKKYLQMTKTEYELIIKLIICTILSSIVSWLVGDLYSPTIMVTSNLFLYCDRGYVGSLRYGTRRVLVQIIQGLLVISLIFPCKYFNLPIPDVALIIISSCIAICIGLPINYKNTYSPVNCTLANATFIISCTAVQNTGIFASRVLECVAGFLIGYFVNYIIFPHKDRVGDIQLEIQECVNSLIYEDNFDKYHKNIALIEKNLKFLVEDSEKSHINDTLSKDKIADLQFHQQLLVSLKNYIEFYERHKDELDDKMKTDLLELFQKSTAVHLDMVAFDEAERSSDAIPIPYVKTNNSAEVCVVGRLIEYISRINSGLPKEI